MQISYSVIGVFSRQLLFFINLEVIVSFINHLFVFAFIFIVVYHLIKILFLFISLIAFVTVEVNFLIDCVVIWIEEVISLRMIVNCFLNRVIYLQ